MNLVVLKARRKKSPKGKLGDPAGVAVYTDSRVSSLTARLAAVMDKWKVKIIAQAVDSASLGKSLGVLCVLVKAKPKMPKDLEAFGDDLRDAIMQDLQESFQAAGTKAATSLGVDMLDVVSERAKEYASQHAAELIDGIDKTTRDVLTDLITQAVSDGWSAADLSDAIASGGVFSEERADMIARTELATAFTEGSISAWEESGVVAGKQWLAAPDCCDICAELDGSVVALDDDFGEVSGPPLHPNCRCDVAPVLRESGKVDLASLLKEWNEEDHPRDEDGQFSSGGGGGGKLGEQFAESGNGKKWIKANQDNYDNDPEFRAAADGIAYLTQGEYKEMRAFTEEAVTGKLPSGIENTLGESVLTAGDEKMAGHPLGSYKNYFQGQDLDKGSSHTYREAASAINSAIHDASPMESGFYRGVYGKEVVDGLKGLKEGDSLQVLGATSFTKSEDTAVRFSQGKKAGQRGGGLVPGTPTAVIEVVSGAKGIDVSTLSPWKQQEVISSGEFRVKEVKVSTRQDYSPRGYWIDAEEVRVVLEQEKTWPSKK